MSRIAAHSALALDELFRDPHRDEMLAEINAQVPPAVADQRQAAARDAHRFLELEAPFLGAPVEELDIARLPDWLRLDLLSTWSGWTSGTGRTCVHDPRPERPEPVFAAAWRPGLIACQRCIHLTVLRPGSKADRTCDCCGHVVAGLDQGEGISPGRLTFGPIVFGYGLCSSCTPDLDHLRGAA
jgi:hypothetical protein